MILLHHLEAVDEAVRRRAAQEDAQVGVRRMAGRGPAHHPGKIGRLEHHQPQDRESKKSELGSPIHLNGSSIAERGPEGGATVLF